MLSQGSGVVVARADLGRDVPNGWISLGLATGGKHITHHCHHHHQWASTNFRDHPHSTVADSGSWALATVVVLMAILLPVVGQKSASILSIL